MSNQFANYEDIANASWGQLPKGKVLPVGSWELKLNSVRLMEPKDEGQDAKVLFIYKAVTPMDDVDEEKLAELGADYDVGLKKIFYTIYIEDASSFERVGKHLALHGITPLSAEENNGTEESPNQTFKRARGAKVIAFLDQRSYVNDAGDTVELNQPSNFTPVGED